jgi:hypothetical protein
MMTATTIGGMLSLVFVFGERGETQAPMVRAAAARQPSTGD